MRAKDAYHGDIFMISLDPTIGSEIRGMRAVLVLSLVGSGTATQGAVVVSQCRVLDLAAKAGKKLEGVPDDLLERCLAKVEAMIARS